MKNKFKNIIFLSIFMLFGALYNAKASNQCDGDNQVFINLTINNCPYEVVLCYECPPTGAINSVRVQGFAKIGPCQQTWDLNQVYNEINNIVFDPDYLRGLIHDCLDNVPPCDENPPSTDFYIRKREWKCWQKNNTNGTIWYWPCAQGPVPDCLTIYKICYDYNLGEFVKTIHSGPQWEDYGTQDCPSSIVPPDPSVGQSSTCFQVETTCTD